MIGCNHYGMSNLESQSHADLVAAIAAVHGGHKAALQAAVDACRQAHHASANVLVRQKATTHPLHLIAQQGQSR